MILDHTSELVWQIIEREILHFVQDDSITKGDRCAAVAR